MKKKVNFTNSQMMSNISYIQHVIDIRLPKGNKLALFGAGESTAYLLQYFQLQEWDIRIVDTYANGEIFGIHIEKPNRDIFDWADTILISAFARRNEIHEYLRKYVEREKIVSLYTNNNNTPFYVQEFEMDAEKLNDICSKDHYGTLNKSLMWTPQNVGAEYEKRVEKVFFREVIKDYYLSYIFEHDQVLDVGAGTGRLSLEIYNVGAHVTAVDVSESMLSVLRNKNKKIKTVRVFDEYLPFAENAFDVVASCDVMIHLLNWEKFLREHARVVKKGGYIIHNMINDDHLKAISDKRWIRSSYIDYGTSYYATVSAEEIKQACERIGNLELVTMLPYGFFFTSAFSYGILTREEMFRFGNIVSELMSQYQICDVVKRFEKEIVSKLPAHMTAKNIVVFQKK